MRLIGGNRSLRTGMVAMVAMVATAVPAIGSLAGTATAAAAGTSCNPTYQPPESGDWIATWHSTSGFGYSGTAIIPALTVSASAPYRLGGQMFVTVTADPNDVLQRFGGYPTEPTLPFAWINGPVTGSVSCAGTWSVDAASVYDTFTGTIAQDGTSASGTYTTWVYPTSGPPVAVDSGTWYGATGPEVVKVGPSHGKSAGGKTVTIKGTGLRNASVVHFGPAVASVVSVNTKGTVLKVVDPAGSPGAVDVTVTTPNGTSATSSADLFTYQA